MKYMYPLFFASMLFSLQLRAQKILSITGEVRDEKQQVLPGATIFLTNTKIITAAENNGTFHLDNVTPGSYQLVVKMIGYVPFIQKLDLRDQSVQLKIKLEPSSFFLKEVKVRPDYEREKHLALFKKEFLGQTYNAKYCKILNPDILYFNYEKKSKILSATADDFLIVKNDALGYEIKYLLTDFGFNENTGIVTYQGYPSFKEMKGSARQEIFWTKNRNIAYLGSVNHFIKAVYANRVSEEGFVAFKILNRPMQGIKPENGSDPILQDKIIAFDSLVTTLDKDSKSLRFRDCLYVIYTREKEPENFKPFSYAVSKEPSAHIPKGQASLVYLLTDSVKIDQKGLYDPANGLFF